MFSKVKDEKVRLLIVEEAYNWRISWPNDSARNRKTQVGCTGEVPYRMNVAMYHHIEDLFLNAHIRTQGLTFVEAMKKVKSSKWFDDNLVDLLTSNNAGLLYTIWVFWEYQED